MSAAIIVDFSTREHIHLTKIQVFLLTLYRAQQTCVPAAVGCVHSVNRITKLLKIKTEIGPLIVSAYKGPILYEIQGRKLSKVLHYDRLKRYNSDLVPV